MHHNTMVGGGTNCLMFLFLITVFPWIVSAETVLFWIWPYVLWPLVTVHKSEETIQGRKLFAEISVVFYDFLLPMCNHVSSMQLALLKENATMHEKGWTDLKKVKNKIRVNWYGISKLCARVSKNGILLPKLFWPTVRKNCSSGRENLLKFEAESQEFKKSFEITRTIYSNSESSEQFLVTECFFNLFLEISHTS